MNQPLAEGQPKQNVQKITLSAENSPFLHKMAKICTLCRFWPFFGVRRKWPLFENLFSKSAILKICANKFSKIKPNFYNASTFAQNRDQSPSIALPSMRRRRKTENFPIGKFSEIAEATVL